MIITYIKREKIRYIYRVFTTHGPEPGCESSFPDITFNRYGLSDCKLVHRSWYPSSPTESTAHSERDHNAKPHNRNLQRNHSYWRPYHRAHCETEEKPYRNVRVHEDSDAGHEGISQYFGICVFIVSQVADTQSRLRQGTSSRWEINALTRTYYSARSLHIVPKRYVSIS